MVRKKHKSSILARIRAKWNSGERDPHIAGTVRQDSTPRLATARFLNTLEPPVVACCFTIAQQDGHEDRGRCGDERDSQNPFHSGVHSSPYRTAAPCDL